MAFKVTSELLKIESNQVLLESKLRIGKNLLHQVNIYKLDKSKAFTSLLALSTIFATVEFPLFSFGPFLHTIALPPNPKH